MKQEKINEAVHAYFRRNPGMTSLDAEAAMIAKGYSKNGIWRALGTLSQAGQIVRHGRGWRTN